MIQETSFVLFFKDASWPIQFAIVGKGLNDNEQRIADGLTIEQASELATLMENPQVSSVLVSFVSEKSVKYNTFWLNNNIFTFMFPRCQLDLSASGASTFAHKIRESSYRLTFSMSNENTSNHITTVEENQRKRTDDNLRDIFGG